MVGRVLRLAVDEGIDISDPIAVSGFTQRFNEMPFEWRQRVTDHPDGAVFDLDELDGFDDDILASSPTRCSVNSGPGSPPRWPLWCRW